MKCISTSCRKEAVYYEDRKLIDYMSRKYYCEYHVGVKLHGHTKEIKDESNS
jgi:hypothetical protein